MYSKDIVKMAKKLKIKGFAGVFSLDRLPRSWSHRPPYRFIVNTHTSNLPGEHWIAVSFESNGKIYAFDPMGFYYPSKLVQYLSQFKKHRPIIFNRFPFQKPSSKKCGQFCLSWLRRINNHPVAR